MTKQARITTIQTLENAFDDNFLAKFADWLIADSDLSFVDWLATQ